MLKVIAVDMDGVVVKRHKVFSARFAEEKGIAIEKIMKFVKSDFQDCMVGKKDLKKVLPDYLKEWGVEDSLDSVLNFWFSGEEVIDEGALEKVRELRRKGIKCYLATNNEKYRVEYMTEKLKAEFDGILASYDLGFKKPNQKFYEEFMKRIGINDPGEVELWDNDAENIKGAQKAGMKTKLWE
jgi:putative hydrolase of the HAD superfamily